MLYDSTGQYQGAFTREQAAGYGGTLGQQTTAGHEQPAYNVTDWVNQQNQIKYQQDMATYQQQEQQRYAAAQQALQVANAANVYGNQRTYQNDATALANSLYGTASMYQNLPGGYGAAMALGAQNIAQQWLGYASNPNIPYGAANAPFGIAPQITQTPGTMLDIGMRTGTYDPSSPYWQQIYQQAGGIPVKPIIPFPSPMPSEAAPSTYIPTITIDGGGGGGTITSTTPTLSWNGITSTGIPLNPNLSTPNGYGWYTPNIYGQPNSQGAGIPGVVDPSGWVIDDSIWKVGPDADDNALIYRYDGTVQNTAMGPNGEITFGTPVQESQLNGGYNPYMDPSSPYYLAPLRNYY